MEKKGNVKGEVIRADLEYIKVKMGEEGLKKIEDRFEELGYPLHLRDIKPFHDYKEAQAVLIYLFSQDLFGWDEERISKMGEGAAKTSFIVKALIRYFVSVERLMEEAPNYWSKHHDFGKLETIDFSEKEKFITFRIIGYDFHPLACTYHRGYFLSVARFSIKGKNISLEETKCVHRGDEYHEYRINWE